MGLLLCRYLVDGQPPSVMGAQARTIMVCSPRNDVYKVGGKSKVLKELRFG